LKGCGFGVGDFLAFLGGVQNCRIGGDKKGGKVRGRVEKGAGGDYNGFWVPEGENVKITGPGSVL